MRIWLAVVGIMLGVAAGGLLLGVLGGALWVSATDDDPEIAVAVPSPSPDTGDAGATSAPGEASPSTQATAPPLPTTEVFEPIAISGNGDRSEPVTALTPGIAIVTMHHEGDGAFKIALERGEGESSANLANASGTWDGARAVLIRDGQQPLLVVTSEGPWSVTIDRPLPTDETTQALPFDASGSQSQALFYVAVPQGKHMLTATHTGDGAFVVTVMNEIGRGRVKLLDVTGDYNDVVEFEGKFFPTSYLIIDIRAAGDWTIHIE